MRSYISVHRATAKYFSNSFIFKTRLKRKDFQEIAPLAQEVPSSNLGAPTTNPLYQAKTCPQFCAAAAPNCTQTSHFALRKN
jgi:hypothetical protein